MSKTQIKKCYLCGSQDYDLRDGKVRDDASLKILECKNCGLVFLSKSDLSKNFYERSKMHGKHAIDANEWVRDSYSDDDRRIKYLKNVITNQDILDFGCGPGGFLLKARIKSRIAVGIELESRLQPHFQDNNLDVVQNLQDLPSHQKFDLITSFHVIEHLVDPADTLKQLSLHLRNGGRIIIEIPSSADALLTLYKNVPFSEFTYWSCHLFLFNASNLKLLAKKAGLKLKFVEHIQRYPLSNHLYWLTKGKPGGHQAWFFLDSKELSVAYEDKLASLGLTDTLIACFSI